MDATLKQALERLDILLSCLQVVDKENPGILDDIDHRAMQRAQDFLDSIQSN